jgi:stage II sporulation protein E
MDFAASRFSRLRAALEKRRDAIACLGAAAGGFVTAASPILSAASPFGLAFAGAVDAPQALWATAGAVAGYLTQTDQARSLRYLASLVLLLGLRWALSFLGRERLALYTPLLAALSVAVTGFAVAFSAHDASYGWAMAFCETAICAAAGILFSRALRGARETPALSGTTGICMGVLLCVLLTGAAQISGGLFPAAYWAALYLVLLAARFGHGGQAVVIGAASGVAAALAGDGYLLPVLTACSLATEAFSPLGRVGVLVSLSLSGLLALLSQGISAAALPFLAGSAAAGAAFWVTPVTVPRALGLVRTPDHTQGEMLRRGAADTLQAARDALSDIAEITGCVSEKLETIRCDRAQSLIEDACRAVCARCPRMTGCWQAQYDTTTCAANAIFFGREDEIPPQFSCARTDALRARLTDAAARYKAQRSLQEQAVGLKTVTVEQFSGMSRMLDVLERRISALACADESVCRSVGELLSSLGAEPISVSCFSDETGRPRLLAEIPARKLARLDPEKTAEALSEVVCRPLGPAAADTRGEIARLTWEEKAPYRAESCFRQQSAESAPLCGDCCRSFSFGGQAALLLSDGMGVGRPAALDAAMTVSLLERMLASGIGLDAGLRIVNAALLSRGEERLCTVDAALLDLHTLTLTCCKAGAAPSYLWREGRVRRIDDSGLPIGILGGAEVARTVHTLREGDVIVLVSDGLTDSGDEWLPSQIAAFAAGPLDALCDSLLKTASARSAGGRADDCTVLAARIMREKI